MVELDHRPIGAGTPGKLTACIIKEFRQRVREDGVRLGVGARR
jgi:hypothetical protein